MRTRFQDDPFVPAEAAVYENAVTVTACQRRHGTELEVRVRAGQNRLGRQLDVLCARAHPHRGRGLRPLQSWSAELDGLYAIEGPFFELRDEASRRREWSLLRLPRTRSTRGVLDRRVAARTEHALVTILPSDAVRLVGQLA